jgi:hypothetical protein
MVAQSLACPGCRDTVPPGRLSCPHCGEVLAAVAPRVAMSMLLEPSPEPGPQPSSPWPPPSAASPPLGTEAEPLLEPEPEPYSPWPPPAAVVPAFAPLPAELAAQELEPLELAPLEPAPAMAPGTYIPNQPAPVPAADEAESNLQQPLPAEPLAEAGEAPPAAIFPRTWDPAAAAAGEGVLAAPAPSTARASFAVPRIDRANVERVADAAMLIGAFGLVLAFLAPWSRVVIGSRGTGYMDTWGLAGSGHIAVFLLALAVLGLAAFQNPIGRWLRTGVIGVALGAFVLGLSWPYVAGPLGAGPGAMLAWVSGVVMFIAGLASLLVLRHAALAPDV